MMGPSCRTKTRKSSSRRKTLFNNSKNQQNSVVVSPAAANIICDPAKPTNCSTKVDVENVDTCYNNSSNSCSTPKAKRYRIPEINTCPPAPKKRRIVRNCSLRRTSPVPFFAPPDIELFFYFALRGIPV